MDKEHPNVMEPSSLTAKPDSSKEQMESTTEAIHSHGGEKEDQATVVIEISERKSETLEITAKECGEVVETRESEKRDVVVISEEFKGDLENLKEDKVVSQEPGNANVGHVISISHSHSTDLGSQNKSNCEIGSQAIKKSQDISAACVQISSDSRERPDQETSEPPQKRIRTVADSVIDISGRDTPVKADDIEAIQVDPIVDIPKPAKPGAEMQSKQNISIESADLEIVETKSSGIKQSKVGVNVAQTKAVSDVILIDEQNTDSQGSAATDDSVIFVDEGTKNNPSGTVQPR